MRTLRTLPLLVTLNPWSYSLWRYCIGNTFLQTISGWIITMPPSLSGWMPMQSFFFLAAPVSYWPMPRSRYYRQEDAEELWGELRWHSRQMSLASLTSLASLLCLGLGRTSRELGWHSRQMSLASHPCLTSLASLPAFLVWPSCSGSLWCVWEKH